MPNPLRRAGALLLAALLVVACDPTVSPSPTPSPSRSSSPTPAAAQPSASPSGTTAPPLSPLPSDDLAAVYQAINEQVRAVRGLEEEEPVEPQIVSTEELGDILERRVREETPPESLSAYERLYHTMGLLPEGQKLDDVYVDLLESQVAGLYEQSENELYVRSEGGGVGPVEKVFYAHEYVHALQDQSFDLDAFMPADVVDQTDRQLARLAVAEGDAYTAMTQWLQANLTPPELLAFFTESQDPKSSEALERIPPIVAAQIVFPAVQGFLWILDVQAQGGWEAVDELFANPPDSTEQILHPDKLASREQPIDVDIPADLPATLGSGWSVGLEDTMGEAQMAVWLSGTAGGGGLPPPPPAGAAGWGGDRQMLLDGPDGARAVVMRTEWDTAADAAEFEEAVGSVLGDAPGVARVLPGEGDVTRWVLFASDDDTLGAVAAALGLAG